MQLDHTRALTCSKGSRRASLPLPSCLLTLLITIFFSSMTNHKNSQLPLRLHTETSDVMTDSMVDDWAPASETRFQQRLAHSIEQFRSRLASSSNGGSRGRRRVGTIIVLGLVLLFLISYNLRVFYITARWWSQDLTGWIVSMVLEIVLSLTLLAILSTIVPEFLTSAMVASAAVGIYIAITFLVDPNNASTQGRCMASWSIPTFWITFVVDAPLKLSYRLTDLLARKMVLPDTGRIRLPERNEDAAKFRYTPSLQKTVGTSTSSSSTVGDVDLEGGSQSSSGRTYAAI